MPRTIQPEILDSLPPHHPDAMHNRRDLRLTNRLMGNHRWIERILAARLHRGERVLELGAGEGDLALRLHARSIRVDGLDRWPRPAHWPPDLAWHQADLRRFPAYDHYAAIVGNLIFHQFEDAELHRLGAEFRHSVRLIVAVEPVRHRVFQLAYRWLGALSGANRVSLHDAHVSIGAGFRGDELPRALGLAERDWEIRSSTTPLGAYRLLALRRS